MTTPINKAELTRNIIVKGVQSTLEYIDLAGKRQALGDVVLDTFGDEKITSMNFRPTNPFAKFDDKTYKLGNGSDRLSLVNPADYQEVALENGWIAESQYTALGGAAMTTVYRGKSSFTSTYEYDLELWKAFKGRNAPDAIFPAISITTNLQVGKMAVEITQGVFRLICTNGMVGLSLFNNGIRANHQYLGNKRKDLISYMLQSHQVDYLSQWRANPIGQVEDFQNAVKVLKHYRQAVVSGDADKVSYLDKTLSLFNGKQHNQLLPDVIDGTEKHHGLIDLFDLMTQDCNDGMVTKLDVANAVTNALQLRRAANGNDQNLWRQSQLLDNTINTMATVTGMAQMAKIFSVN